MKYPFQRKFYNKPTYPEPPEQNAEDERWERLPPTTPQFKDQVHSRSGKKWDREQYNPTSEDLQPVYKNQKLVTSALSPPRTPPNAMTTTPTTVFAEATPLSAEFPTTPMMENLQPLATSHSMSNQPLDFVVVETGCSKRKIFNWLISFAVIFTIAILLGVIIGSQHDSSNGDKASTTSQTQSPVSNNTFSTIPTATSMTPTTTNTNNELTIEPTTLSPTEPPLTITDTPYPSTNVPVPTPSTVPPEVTPTLDARATAIVAYINSIKLSFGDIVYPLQPIGGTTAEERAVQWLIDQDPLMLSVGTPENEFHLCQRYALLTLWFQGETTNWIDSSGWLTEPDECAWYGVTCEEAFVSSTNAVMNVVYKIDLGEFDVGNQLQGTLSADLALLTMLEHLELPSNAIFGTIPESIWSLAKLTELDLHETNVYGTISPSIAKLLDLESLDLSSTLITGNIPELFWDLSELTFLNLFDLDLHGSLPSSIGSMMSNLKSLSFSQTSFTGTIPPSLWDLTQLTWLDVGIWQDTNPFPQSIGNLHGLRYLGLSGGKFTGAIPEALWSLSNLIYLNLYSLDVSGTIPSSIGSQLSLLLYLDLGSNSMSGTVPDSIWDLTNLEFLCLCCGLQMASCSIPESISTLSQLDTLYMESSFFTGTLPASIGSLSLLKAFSFESNSLVGTLPETIGGWTDLTLFSVANNQLYGTIPPSIASWIHMERAYFENNDFTGTMPSEICAIGSLQYLSADPEVSCSCCSS